ncbi:GntR family transcriptional regulator [Citrobacter freundii]|jgi:GntR family transcriptional regulator|uniref:GntR family transcriptional regulator n=1 Tax=Gammaproteobacteria TaxID=1236 RepID=UPI002597CA0C|nr:MULTISPECIES: GntR family transcriptional regulator [Enterobacteriaceae]MCU3690562.1 GntR family transcriptional regulator [Enterobacter hormaechei subsp. steigerwaltii]HCR1388176.1 GntR family transcriptional regulator [Pseudomonas aeruginosa]HEJ7837729.1 GntR family transcriptional regulator [Serratia marcescens]MDM4377522.1 GntR family transcriptional regulator [Klebsiella oxytoca]MDT7358250.1 GntR family transcriptional regulator [Citrobacter freundii]
MSIELDHSPLYTRVEAALAADISSAALPCGSQLPSENQLIERFEVSRTTVRKAIENLVARGLVEIRRGKGTFVAEPKLIQELNELSGFVEDMVALGRHPTARLLDKRPVAATKEVAQHLGVTLGAQVYRIERVRLADGVAMSFDETYLPLDIGEKVASNDLEAEPIFDLLENKYELPLVEAQYQLEAATANEHVAQALGVEVGSPIFLIERTSYTEGHRPVDYEKLYYRGDLIRFSTRLSRRARTRT